MTNEHVVGDVAVVIADESISSYWTASLAKHKSQSFKWALDEILETGKFSRAEARGLLLRNNSSSLPAVSVTHESEATKSILVQWRDLFIAFFQLVETNQKDISSYSNKIDFETLFVDQSIKIHRFDEQHYAIMSRWQLIIDKNIRKLLLHGCTTVL